MLFNLQNMQVVHDRLSFTHYLEDKLFDVSCILLTTRFNTSCVKTNLHCLAESPNTNGVEYTKIRHVHMAFLSNN